MNECRNPSQYPSPHVSITKNIDINIEDDICLQTYIILQVKYLVGAANQFEDVDLWMWFPIICQ